MLSAGSAGKRHYEISSMTKFTKQTKENMHADWLITCISVTQ